MYALLAQVAAPAITLLLLPTLFGSTAHAGPVPQQAPAGLAIKQKYRVPGAALPPLVSRKRDAEAEAYVPVFVPRAANAEPEAAAAAAAAAAGMKRDAAPILVTLPKREPQPNAGSNVSLQPQKRGYGRGGCCGGGGWGW